MRGLCFVVIQMYMGALSLCYSSEKGSSFNVLILKENDSLCNMHESDAKKMKQTFKSIGEVLKKPVRISCWDTKKISFHKIKKWCSKIHPKDIAIVYYSGQEAQLQGYNGLWPLTKIGKKEISVASLAHAVYARNARLSLVFTDCYNTTFKMKILRSRVYGQALEKVKKRTARLKIRRVWDSAKGQLTLCSSKYKEPSLGLFIGKNKTGAFTEALLFALTFGANNDSHSEMTKLSKFGLQTEYHMKRNFSFSKKPLVPFYSSTIVEE